MSHHGKDLNELSEDLEELKNFQKKITGHFPDGKLTQNDEGALGMKVTNMGDKVVIAFGEPTSWVGMTGDQAAKLATDLLRRAKQVGITEPVTITL